MNAVHHTLTMWSFFSKSFDEHIEHDSKVFQTLKLNGIKQKAKKCDLFKKGVKYLE